MAAAAVPYGRAALRLQYRPKKAIFTLRAHSAHLFDGSDGNIDIGTSRKLPLAVCLADSASISSASGTVP